MAVELATAYISLVPSFRGGEAAIAREASRMGTQTGGAMATSMGSAITKSTGRGGALGRSFSSISTGMKAFAGVAAVGLAADAISGFIAEAEDAAKVTRATEAVIKSTGGVARVTAADINSLADSLSTKSGIDDEVIASGTNVLLTFTNIRNEVGAGNDIFNQGAEAALNMSSALGQDLQGSVTLVGKALNDPIAGMSALTRAGVQFTDEQKNTIKALVETGDTLGAQKIILAELTTQFGGAAEANATASGRMSVAWGNVQEQLGNVLLPIFERVANFMTEHLPGAVAVVQTVLQRLGPVFEVLGTIIGVWIKVQVTMFQILIAGWQGLIAGITAIVQTGVAVVLAVWNGLQPMVSFINDWIIGPIVAAVQGFAGILGDVIQGVVDTAILVWNGLQSLVSFINGWVIAPIVVVVQGFAGIIGGLIQGVVDAANLVWTGLSALVSFLNDWVIAPISLAVSGFADVIGGVIQGLVDTVKLAWDGLGAMVSFLNDFVINPIKLAVSGFASGIEVVIGGLVGVVKSTWEGLGAIVSWFNDNIVFPVTKAVLGLSSAVVAIFEGIVDGVRTAWGWLTDAVKVPINLVIGFYNSGIVPVWNATVGNIPGIGFDIPTVNKLNVGGYVPGPDVNKDVVPALLTPGEFVINKKSAKNIGPGLLEWLNDGGLRGTADPGIFGYATGGPVRSLQETMAFAQGQVGKPYQWPSRGPTVGPGSYDCSGFTSAVLNFALGLNPHSRRHSSTSQVNDPALAPGLGAANGLSFGNRAAFMLNKFGQSVGHTALTLGGVNFEATPPRVRSGGGAKGAASFPRHMHLPRFGGPSPEQLAMATDVRNLGAGAPAAGTGWGMISGLAGYIASAVGEFLKQQIIKFLAPWWEEVGDFFSRGIQPSEAFASGGMVRRDGPILVGEQRPEIRWGSRGQYIQAMEAGSGDLHLHVHGDIVGDAAWKRTVHRALDDGFRERRREALAGSRHP